MPCTTPRPSENSSAGVRHLRPHVAVGLLAIAGDFVRALSILTGTLIVCGVGWGMHLTERNDVARRVADAEEKARLSKRNALK